MTLQTSSAKSHPVSNFLWFTLKKQTPITLLATAFILMVCPGMLFKEIFDSYEHNYGSNTIQLISGDQASFGLLIYIAGLAVMFLLLLINFGFLFSKKSSDMYQALPVTRNEMLVVRGFSSFVGGLFAVTLPYAGVGIAGCMPHVEGMGIAQYIIGYLLLVLFIAISTAITTLIIICCGGYFDTFVALGSVTLFPIVLMAIFFNVTESIATGITFGPNPIVYTSPYLYMGSSLYSYLLPDYYTFYHFNSSAPITVWGIIFLVVLGCLAAFAASKLYGRRKSEKAGEAYAFKFVSAAIGIMVSVAGGWIIGWIFSDNSNGLSAAFWLFFIIGALLSSMTVGVIMSRGFKTVKSSLIRGGLASALALVLTVTAVFSAMGAETYVPNPKGVKAVGVDLIYKEDVVIKDNPEIITDIHKIVVKNIKEGKNYADEEMSPLLRGVSSLGFTYRLKSGIIVEREYSAHYYAGDKSLYEPYLKYLKCDERLTALKRCFESERESGRVGISYYPENATDKEYTADLTQEQANKLYELYKSEIEELTTAAFDKSVFKIHISGEVYVTLLIPEDCTATQSYVKSFLFPEEP